MMQDGWATFQRDDGLVMRSYKADLTRRGKSMSQRPKACRLSFGGLYGVNERKPDKAAWDKIYAIEDRMDEILGKEKSLWYLGRVVHEGSLFMYVYAPETHSLDLEKEFAELWPQVEVNYQHDPQGEAAMLELMPTEEELAWIVKTDWNKREALNEALIQQLGQQGDDLTAAREVDHTGVFDVEANALAFVAAAGEVGFPGGRVEKYQSGWVVKLVAIHAVTRDAIDPVTLRLMALMEAHRGVYDGWGCVVVKKKGILSRLKFWE